MTDSTPTVLIVEDQAGLAEAYEAVLRTEYETRVATSGNEALELIDDSVDVVLLDRRMPGMSGDDVLEVFVERGISAMVAMVTAVEPAVDIVDMSFDEYVTKPIDNDELRALVRTLLERSEYDESVQQFFSLAAKKSALEATAKTETAEYEQLVTEMERLREEIKAEYERTPDEINQRAQAR